MKTVLTVALVLFAGPSLAQDTSPAQLVAKYAAEAGITPSAETGKAMFMASHSGGKPDTPSCTTCHTDNPRVMGMARTGKPIEPMASSANPARFTDTAFVEKWFGRNCDSVLGRACTAAEKAHAIAWLSSI
jgi:cytochrome c peroxidase